jgi:hypothetical protein
MLLKALVLCKLHISCAPIALLAIRLGLLLPAYRGLRCLFLVFNWRQLAEASRSDLFYAMAKGLRFDLSTILLLNIPLILLDIALPAPRLHTGKWFRRIYSVSFMLFNFIPLAIEAIDIEGYKFFGRRSTLSTLSILNDIRDQALQLIIHFWYISLICMLVITGLVLLFQQVSRRVESSRLGTMALPLPAWISLGFVTVAMTTLGIRGGLQSKPLRPIHAFSSQSTVLASLALNTTFNVEDPFISSAYSGNEIHGLPEVLRSQGYAAQ